MVSTVGTPVVQIPDARITGSLHVENMLRIDVVNVNPGGKLRRPSVDLRVMGAVYRVRKGDSISPTIHLDVKP